MAEATGGILEHKIEGTVDGEIGHIQQLFNEMVRNMKFMRDNLTEQNERLQEEIYERKRSEEALQKAHEDLERRVEERTVKLAKANEQLKREITERKQSEEALRQSEELYRSLVEGSIQGILIHQESIIQFANQSAARIFGYTGPDELVGKNLWEALVAPEERAELNARNTTMMQGKRIPAHPRWQGIRKDGTRIWVQSTASLISWQNGPAGLSFYIDVTEAKQTMDALKESEDRYRTLVENVPIAVYRNTPGPKGKILMGNPAYYRMFGFDSEVEFKHFSVDDFYVNPEERKLFSDNLLAQGSVNGVELALKKKDGTPFWGSVSARVVYDESGEVSCFDCTIMDITARKRAEEALRDSEEKYRLLVESSSDAVLMLDRDRKIVSCNQAFLDLFGYDKNEIEGRSIGIIHQSDESFHSFGETAYPVIKRTGTFRTEWDFMRKDGAIFPVETATSVIKSPDGSTIGYVAIIRDITERRLAEKEQKKLEAQLQRAQKMEAIGTLAGGVAHDLNNILAGLVSYPELLLLEIPEDSPLRNPILTMQKSGQKAATIVEDLLALARRGVAVTEVVDLNDIISGYLKSPEHERLISFHPGVNVRADLEGDLLNILGAPAHLSKTIMNLASNAAEAMPDGGEISISTENQYIDRPIRGYDNVKEGDYVVLKVSDTGVGISKKDKERIFEPFYTKKLMGRSGTGLGMTVVWGTVKDHKGYIDIKSAKGKGTTFTLYFPVSRKELPKDKSLLSIENYMAKGESVLVVDDVAEQREIASKILKKLGYSVTSVSSGEEAVDYLKDNSTDLLVLDMIMDPGIDGFETYKRILEFHPVQKALIVSGFAETKRVKEAQRLGAGAYVKKPFLLERIGLAVRDELDR
jgi:PAS domain S-box-containing protein